MAKRAKAPTERIRRVEALDPSMELAWVEPASLDEHPDNWRVHGPEQTAVVGDLIQRHGWIEPVVYNRTTGRLLNGHARRKIAIERGYPAVPVVIVQVPEESEPEILLALDPSSEMATGDPSAIRRLLEELGEATPAIDDLIDQLSERHGVLEHLAGSGQGPKFTAPGDGPREVSFIANPAPPPISHVRQVQLFYDLETFPEFSRMVEALAAHHKTETPSDTVLAVLREAYQAAGERAAG